MLLSHLASGSQAPNLGPTRGHRMVQTETRQTQSAGPEGSPEPPGSQGLLCPDPGVSGEKGPH